ncbi:MAG: UDP-N-acetylmuramoyl-L-alanine--D-glutamate ligase [Mariprofundaceae bacterium]|nr:UDP-N-acetylmuramoyl-L-alanine--D-glutamate ligase [Mariprofundaceae bacterium]
MNEAVISNAILGMGQTGISLARFLLQRGEQCEGFDAHKVKLPNDLKMPLHIGRFKAEKLKNFSRVIVSPGIRWDSPVLAELRQRQVPVCGDLDLFLEHYQGPTIAITGTNGKTTTTSLVELMLETLPGGIEAGGNIGRPMLDLLRDNRQPARIVLELSSFQLERSHGLKPDWAVLLNFQSDHADMHGTEQEYLAAKLRMFEQQGEGDTAMFPADKIWDEQVASLSRRGVRTLRFGHCDENDAASDLLSTGIMQTSNGPVIFWSQDRHRQQVPCDQIPARGAHQHMNMAVAAQVAADYGVSQKVVRETMTCFKGLKHRLEHIGMQAGRDWFDDSKATNPDAAIAALNSFEKVTWICGGLRKELDLAPLAPVAHKRVSHALVIGKETAPYAKMLKQAEVPHTVAGNIRRAVSMAAKLPGNDPVLLSPAAASQDQFKNYAERGEAFSTAVASLGGDK